MKRYMLVALVAAGLTLTASPAMAHKWGGPPFGHGYGPPPKYGKSWGYTRYNSYTVYPNVVYRSYSVPVARYGYGGPVYYRVVPAPPPPPVFSTSGFSFWFY